MFNVRRTMTIVLSLAIAVCAQGTLIHPGIFGTQADLDDMRAAVTGATSHPMKAGYATLQAFEGADLSWNPTVYATVNYVGSGGSASESAIRNSGHAVYAHALQWVITGDRRHADKAIAIMRAWATGFVSLEGAPSESQNQLETSWDIPIWLAGAEIIRRYNNGAAGWSAGDIAAFDGFLDILIAESDNLWKRTGNNWITSGNLAHLCVAVWRSDTALFSSGMKWWKENAKAYIYDSGQLMETTRDCNHAEYGIIGLMMGAEVIRNQGIDVYSYTVSTQSAPRLWLGMEFQAKALLGEPVGGTQNCVNDDQHGPGWEMGFNHYANRTGRAIPNTETFVLQHNRPVGLSESHFPGWTTLTHANLDAAGTTLAAVLATRSAMPRMLRASATHVILTWPHGGAWRAEITSSDGRIAWMSRSDTPVMAIPRTAVAPGAYVVRMKGAANAASIVWMGAF